MFLRSRVGVFVKISFFCHLLTITVAGNGCKESCNEKWSVKIAYENCLRQCSQKFSTETAITSQKIKSYPKPPQNIRVDLSVRILRYTKYITAKVNWDSDKDEKRDGFYLSFLSKSTICETKFPGFHTLNIPSDANYFDIPNQTPSFQPLLLDFGCSYQLEMRSKPYPYGDPAFTSIAVVDIPNCIDGYCTCRSQQKLQDPKNLNIMTIDDGSGNNTKVQVSWQFSFQNDRFGKDTIEFRVKLAELLRKADIAPWKKIFRWTQWEEAIVAEKSKEKYTANLPMLVDGNEYKVQVFAFNQHFCRSQEIEKEFIASTDYKSTIIFDIFSTLAPAGTTATFVSFDNSTDTSVEVTTVTSFTAISATVNSTKDLPVVTHALATAPPKDEYLMVFLPIIGMLCLIISMFAAWKFYSSHKEKLLKKKQYLSQMHENPWTLIASGPSTLETNILYTEKEITEARAHGFADDFEISYERISLGRVIGQGAFGLVYMGQAESIRGVSGPTQVAIKQLKANADDRERKEFLSEIEMMKMITPHPNIVTMYGCCTLMYPHCMVMDYVPYGDLLKYLRNLRKEFEQKIEEYRVSLERDYIMQLATHPMMTRAEINTSSVKRVQTSRQQDLSAYDIMSASSNSHRGCQCGHCDNICDPIPFVDDSDLNISGNMGDYGSFSLDVAELQSFALQVACGMAHLENLQITHRDLACRNILVGHGKILKISDFGLSRTGIYVKTTSGRIPLRWLSLEAMRDHAYSTKSDVWAYGVVLWEICTLGGFPYPTMADKEILKYLESGNRLDKPGSCSDNIYKLMMQCWSSNPSQRPSFCNIKRTLKEMDNDGHAYVEFLAQDDMSLPPQDYCRIVPLATLDEIRMGPNV